MTDKEKARAYDEALERARKRIMVEPQDHTDKILKDIFPQLAESEDERIRKFLIDILSHGTWRKEWPFGPNEVVAYLEKQKDNQYFIGYANGYSDGQLNPKQKEPNYTKRNELFDKCVENCDPKVMKEVSDNVDKMLEPKIAFGDWGDKEKKEAIITCLQYMRFIKKITNQEYDDLMNWLDNNLVYNALKKKQKEQKQEWKPQPESLEALMYAIEGKWDMILPTSYLSRRLEDLYEGLVNTFNVDESLLAELPKAASLAYTAEDIEELKELKRKIEASMEQKQVPISCSHENGTPAESKATINGEPIQTENQSVDIPLAVWSEKYIADVFEKVGLAKIVREQGNDALTNAIQSAMIELSKVENTEWNEEDKTTMNDLISLLWILQGSTNLREGTASKYTHWLKSLPERFNLQPKIEWNEEDEKPSIFPPGLGEVHWNPIPSAKKELMEKAAEKLSKEEYVKKFKALCEAYEIKLPNREYDIYGLCEDLHKLFGDIQNPVEWSDEDENMRNLIIETLDDNSHYFPFKETKKKMMDWLKSLRPQSHWKPSEEQMTNLLRAEGRLRIEGENVLAGKLAEIYEQLKKL